MPTTNRGSNRMRERGAAVVADGSMNPPNEQSGTRECVEFHRANFWAVVKKLSTASLATGRRTHNRRMDTVSSDSVGRFLTVADAADILNISAAEVTELIRTTELPAISVGAPGRWRIERVQLEAYIAGKYEEARRMSLWEESDIASLPEIARGTIFRPKSD